MWTGHLQNQESPTTQAEDKATSLMTGFSNPGVLVLREEVTWLSRRLGKLMCKSIGQQGGILGRFTSIPPLNADVTMVTGARLTDR